MKKIVWMCAGQGTQFYQMGRELYAREPVFREFLEEGNQIAEELLQVSLLEIIYQPRSDRFAPFRRLLYTHPALLLFECALGKLLRHRGLQPDYLLGHSLGEFSALAIAGVFPFAEVLRHLIKQAELFEYCAPRGGMLAILESIDLIQRYPAAFRSSALAGENFSRNFVVSALTADLEALRTFLRERQINFLDLPIEFPFHSQHMEVVRTPCLHLLQQLVSIEPGLPVVSALTGERINPWSSLAAHLWQAIRAPTNFEKSIHRLEQSGPYLYIDLTPSGSMATALKYILAKDSRSEYLTISSPFGQEAKNLDRVVDRGRAVTVA